jgi:hypothetical protein
MFSSKVKGERKSEREKEVYFIRRKKRKKRKLQRKRRG